DLGEPEVTVGARGDVLDESARTNRGARTSNRGGIRQFDDAGRGQATVLEPFQGQTGTTRLSTGESQARLELHGSSPRLVSNRCRRALCSGPRGAPLTVVDGGANFLRIRGEWVAGLRRGVVYPH